jgi:catechol 2,3-dioxygenase-like lactoylglutathione lyase family enzyme
MSAGCGDDLALLNILVATAIIDAAVACSPCFRADEGEDSMNRFLSAAVLTLLVLTPASHVSAQLLVAKDGPIVYGHHHLNTTNMDAQKKFFVETLGGTVLKIGANQQEIVKFPNVLIFFRPMQAPTGGTRGTTVNHIGFSVPDLRPVIDKIKANGFQMITRSEVAATVEVKDDIALNSPTTSIAFALGPDDVKVELVQVKAQTIPITMHHVHFFGQQNTEMRDWYAKVFGAKPRETPNFAAADLPGVALNFTKSPDPTIGTQGRALDHIGFEVKNLEEFTKKLEGMGIKLERPYTKVAALNIAIAFFKDPWGTYVELTEGLDKVS